MRFTHTFRKHKPARPRKNLRMAKLRKWVRGGRKPDSLDRKWKLSNAAIAERERVNAAL